MSEHTKWTPGPYRLVGDGIAIAGAPGEGEILRATERFMDRAERQANASRAFACLSAMDGIPDPAAFVEAARGMAEALDRTVHKFDAAPDSIKGVPLGIMKCREALTRFRAQLGEDV